MKLAHRRAAGNRGEGEESAEREEPQQNERKTDVANHETGDGEPTTLFARLLNLVQTNVTGDDTDEAESDD